MTIEQARDFVELIREKIGRFPVIYGANLLRESLGSVVDPLLKKCPLWYARFREVPIGIPRELKTWESVDAPLYVSPGVVLLTISPRSDPRSVQHYLLDGAWRR
jgi:hypothetical protein